MKRPGLLLLLLAGPAFAEPGDGGASISVSVNDGGDTTIEVQKGDVKVSAGGQQTQVTAGQAVEVKKGHKAQKVSRLGTPGSLAPGDGARLSSADVTLGWDPVRHADRYRVTVAGNAALDKPQQETTVAATTLAVKLPAGSWYWRVTALDRDGLEGRPSSVRKLHIDVSPYLKPGKPTWK
jgi:hypothetical protein